MDGQSVLGASHHVVVGMMGGAAQRGQVALTVRRRSLPPESYRDPGQGMPGMTPGYPYDVSVSRLENEGFGFVIISSVSRAGSTIGRIIPGQASQENISWFEAEQLKIFRSKIFQLKIFHVCRLAS